MFSFGMPTPVSLTWIEKRPFSDVFKPIIAAVNGYCIAGGLEFLQGTDLRIAAEHATFGLGEVRWDRFCSALYAVGYDRWISIEHEDRAFEGDLDLVKRGFLIARDVLRPYVH